MCTAVTYKTKDFYFGRTLDYDFSYVKEITVTPRNFVLDFREAEKMTEHYAMIGMAYVRDNYPLYYDAVNEKGLCMAGLNFVGNAYYAKLQRNKINLAQFELIPYILGKCSSVKQAVSELKKINLADIRYSDDLPSAELHWIIADREKAVTVEYVKDGLKIYDNKAGVLTNNPTFDKQIFNLNNYIGLSSRDPKNNFSKKLGLKTYTRGMGGLGLPGDYTSQSRFVKATFIKLNSISGSSEEESVNQFFHILGSVANPRGACIVGNGSYEITVYASCCNADKGIYYYTTYENHRITAVEMRKHNLNGDTLSKYLLGRKEDIFYQNK